MTKKVYLKWLYDFLIVGIPLLVYVAVLTLPIPPNVGLSIRHNPVIAMIVIPLVLYPAYRGSSWLAASISLSITLILFALPLAGLWNSGTSETPVYAGLFPVADGRAYYEGASRLLEGSNLSGKATWRPLFPGVLATLLGLTHQNLQFTLAILTAITGLSCFLVAREVQRSHGTAASLMVITVLFLFARRWIGTTWMESLGLSLGAVAFALLWRGARQRQINISLLGTLLLTLALNARAGAFFVLPALILWGSWFFRAQSRFSKQFLIGGIIAVLLGFAMNFVLLTVTGDPSQGFSNFSYTLYGLVVGGQGWQQVLSDYPEIQNLTEPVRSQRIYDLAFEAFRSNPFGIVAGAGKAWGQYLNPFHRWGALSFISTPVAMNEPDKISPVVYILYALSLLGLFQCYRQRRAPNSFLILVACIGILTSVPFVPPSDAQRMRVYAATIPVSAILPTLGLTFFLGRVKWDPLLQIPERSLRLKIPLVYSVLLIILCFLGPITTKVFSYAPQFTKVTCQDDQEAVHLRINQGSFINLVSDNSMGLNHLPNLQLSDVKERMRPYRRRNKARREVFNLLSGLDPGTTFTDTLSLKDQKLVRLVTDSTMMLKQSSIVAVCGEMKEDGLYANSIQKVDK